MKKIALSILSLFILLGGIFITACDRNISLSISPQYEEIEIYTNSKATAGNYKEKMVIVDLKNSNDGIGVDILTGQGSVHILESKPVSRGNGQYSFTIVADESGEARLRIYAIEDFGESVEISVYVKTKLEKIVLNGDDDFKGSSRFAVRGQDKMLQAEDYFDLYPLSANVKDLGWEFADEGLLDQKTLVVGGIAQATIDENGCLNVKDSATVSSLNIRAFFKDDPSISKTVELEVLNDATIESLEIDGSSLYGSGVPAAGAEGILKNLKRNDSSFSSITGTLVVNSQYSIELLPEVYSYATDRSGEKVLSKHPLSESEFQKYFTFNIQSKNVDAGQHKTTYEFVIDSRDAGGQEKLFGDFCFFFKIKYDDYNYSVSTKDDDARLYLDVEYTAQKIELLNENYSNLNNTTIDIFSSYISGNGYKISPLIYPNDVAIDNSNFKIQIDGVGEGELEDFTSVDQFLKVYYLGKLVSFSNTPGSTTWISRELVSNSALYFASAEEVDVLEGVEVKFISVGNPVAAKTSIYFNLYKISEASELSISSARYNEVDVKWEKDVDNPLEGRTFVSSSLASSRKLSYTVMVEGFSTISGLTLETTSNARFDFSDLKLVGTGKDATNNNFVVLSFDVELVGYNFASETKFWLKHVTGKKSDEYIVESFVPLTNASIQSGDNSNTSIYINQKLQQSFVKTGLGVEVSGELAHSSSSLSKIVLEAGISLPIDINYNNASLRDGGINVRYLSLSDYASLQYSGHGVDEALALAIEDFSSFDADKLETLAIEHYAKFTTLVGTGLFSISKGSLIVEDNEFQGFVCVEFDGYDEDHQEATICRFFAIESLYSVKTLSPNIETKELFTSETLSLVDMSRSYVDVVVGLRFDDKIPTYSNDLSLFEITSEVLGESGWVVSAGGTRLENDYYTISNISFGNEGKYLKFRITANSTQLQSKVNDTISIKYQDKNGIKRNAAIEISIKNVKRIESVEWVNRTGEQKDLADGEIYLNLTTTVESEKNFTVSTAVQPSDANDNGLSYYYAETFGSSSDLSITTSDQGQIFNLKIATESGGYGNLYLMPNDMVKIVEGVQVLLVYKYELDADGKLVENVKFVEFDQLDFVFADIINGQSYESVMAGEDSSLYEYSNFFLNNDGRAILYSDIFLKIKVVIADGLSENTAIRIYNATDLSAIDYSKYYKIMNNINFSGWKTLADRDFSGMLFGNHSDITLTFTNGSQNFVDVIARDGVIKDLVFAGEVSIDIALAGDLSGFIANVNNGTISNVSVDVYYDNEKDIYTSSKIVDARPEVNVGGLVGKNTGIIENSYAYGISIDAQHAYYIGGLVGNNENVVRNCGVEFYTFEDEHGVEQYNKFSASSANYGGIVGTAKGSSVIEGSYAYAYSLVDDADYSKVFDGDAVGGFVGKIENGATIRQSFAYLGKVAKPFYANDSGAEGKLIDSYFSYFDNGSGEVKSYICKNAKYTSAAGVTGAYSGDCKILDSTDKDVSGLALDGLVWELDDVDEDVNFGYIYLKNVYQSTQVETKALNLKDISDGTKTQVLVAREDDGTVTGEGIMFVYDPTFTVVAGSAEDSELLSYNTIRLTDLFENVTLKQSRSLLLTSVAKNLVINSTSIQVLEQDLQVFTVKVHSKMDFTDSKEFKFIIMNALPRLQTMVNSYQFSDGQTFLLQQGKTRSVVYNAINSVYLNGNAYALEKNSYDIEFNQSEWDDVSKTETVIDSTNLSERKVSVAKSNNSLVFEGIASHDDNDYSRIQSRVVVEELVERLAVDNIYKNSLNAIKAKLAREYNFSVYQGATGLSIENANALEVKPSQHAVFDVDMQTDFDDDNIFVGLKYGEIEVDGKYYNGVAEVKGETLKSANKAIFKVDEKLSVQFTWVKSSDGSGSYSYAVVVKILDENKHLVDKKYDNLQILVNAFSQRNNTEYLKTIALRVRPEELEDATFTTYSVGSRQIKNSILYLRHSNMILNTLTPSSDAIVALAISPQYAKISHFKLTYSLIGEGTKGTISLSKLSYNSIYGYHVDSRDVSFLVNGLDVQLTEEDRKNGNGMFYFRLYVSSSFKANTTLRLRVDFYDGDTLVAGKSVSHELKIDYMQEASVKVNGSSTYLLAKGESATISINVAKNQSLYDLHLQNNASGITLSSWVKQETESGYTYIATLNANVNAKVMDKDKNPADSGVFYVCATVERIINGEQEIKESRATVCLVDFSIDGSGISLQGSTKQEVYNGKSYDVFRSYVGSTEELVFDYPMLPAEYNYDANDTQEVLAVELLEAERAKFALNHYYKNEEVGYYINHEYVENRGIYQELTLKQLLWTASSEEDSSKAWNDNYQMFAQNSFFSMQLNEVSAGGGTYETITISGKRSGRQLMKLRTSVIYQGIEFVYDYYFLVVVEIYNDEDAPTQIDNAEKFVDYLTNSSEPADYILMNDIVLNNYTPLNTDKIRSFDGNGFTIHLNSFSMPEDSSSLNLALFNTVNANTTLKNMTVNIYNAGQLTVNIAEYTNINVAGFALTNNGIIYNCQVISYYDELYQKSVISGNTGIVLKYIKGANTDPILLTEAMGIDTTVAGFVLNNNASIANSRVGGENFKHIVEIVGQNYVRTDKLNNFTIEAQGDVAGFVATNEGEGTISACFADCLQIYNRMQSNTSLSAGFVLYNNNYIQGSYVEGAGEINPQLEKGDVYRNDTNINAMGIVAGFVYTNQAHIKNSYANIAIENNNSKSSMVAGFVYKNEASGLVELCFAVCEMPRNDINQMEFSGVDEFANTLNKGKISLSYYFSKTSEATNQTKLTSGALIVTEIYGNEKDFYGFSFSSGEDAYDGIWKMTDEGITLVSANQIALSNRYSVTSGDTKLTNVFYNKNILDVDQMRYVDLSYGSENNPIIIRSAYDFAVATGKATAKEISSYKEYYSNTEVFGHYRLVDNLDMAEIDQNEENDGGARLTTTEKLMKGVLDGNGFTITNINLGSNQDADNFGLFATMDNAVVMNLNLVVDSIHNSQALVVGGLAGTAVDSRIIAINLSPVESENNNGHTSIQGKNVVGGVVGMLFGNSKLNDINIQDIEVYSSYYDEDKAIDENKSRTGEYLRTKIETNSSLKNEISKISYAGAVAGYVDIYSPTKLNGDPVAYDSSLDVLDYHLITIKVTNSVNIYGEVAGGIFGYIGDSTLVYDASITLNADGAKTTPSYIISKNLFAGGVVGENHGGLFAVSASYSNVIEEQIQSSENAYYNGNTAVERGQESIFSYEEDDAGYVSNKNAPMFIGGVAGYMSGGYIYIGYNKLNVISRSEKTLAVGGVVGFADDNDYLYEVQGAATSTMVNMFLKEVYSAGDLYIDGVSEQVKQINVSGGIVGSVEKDVSIAMQYAMSVNYYGYNSYGLLGDVAPEIGESSYVSDRHFMLIGGVVETGSMQNVEVAFEGSVFLLNTENEVFDMNKAMVSVPLNNPTVGGYYKVTLGSSGTSYMIKTFGMEVKSLEEEGSDIGGNEKSSLNILYADNVGEPSMSSPSASYAKMYNYFLARGWTYAYWIHEEATLFPEIQLTPKIDIIFWDVYNTMEVLSSMQNSGVTVVVRGRLTADPASDTYKDIDLRLSSDGYIYNGLTFEEKEEMEKLLPIEGFTGTLISYYNYMGTDDMATVSDGEEITRVGGTGEELIGGSFAENVGIVMDTSLFKSLGKGVAVIGLNLYFVGGEPEIGGAAIGAAASPASLTAPKLADGTMDMAILRDLNFVYNDAVTVTSASYPSSVSSSGTITPIGAMGLITDVAFSTSFVNITITSRIREDDETTPIAFDLEGIEDREVASVGILAGYMAQRDSATQVQVDSINFVTQNTSKGAYDPEFEKNGAEIIFKNIGTDDITKRSDVNIGLYTGLIEKTVEVVGSRGKISVGLTNLENVNVELINTTDKTKLTVGGFVGKASGVDKVSIKNQEVAVASDGLNIIQKDNIDTMIAGIGFGKIEGGDIFELVGAEGALLKLKGKVYQMAGSLRIAQIGGLAGVLDTPASLTNIAIDFSVGGQKADATVYDSVLNDYTSGTGSVKGFNVSCGGVISGTTSDLTFADNAIGGLFGYAKTSVTLLDNVGVSGSLEIDSDNMSVGGMIGKTIDALTINTKESKNEMNIAVVGDETVYVGGVLGWAGKKDSAGEDVDNQRIDINSISLDAGAPSTLPAERMTYSGIVLASVKNLHFGGAIGYSNRTTLGTGDNASLIKNYVYSGAVKLFWTPTSDSKNVTIGGVVGTLEGTPEKAEGFVVDCCLTYGDAFVNYDSDGREKLDVYTFGGIIGSAYADGGTKTTRVTNSYSLMSSFNEKTTNTNQIQNYNVHAIVGNNSEGLFEGSAKNYYNSSVSMAYQEDQHCVDIYYAKPVDTNKKYNGYIVDGNPDASADSIMEKLESVFSSDDYVLGHKLNPVLWGADIVSDNINDLEFKYIFEDDAVKDSGGAKLYEDIESFNGITWVSMRQDVKTDTVIADTFSNMAFVGNGYTMHISNAGSSVTATGGTVVPYGGLVNKLGKTDLEFNVISGLVVDLDINFDINRSSARHDTYGGIAGQMKGHSILYGVGANGEISVGGENQKLWLGGLVGSMETGKIEYCYQDCDIVYRGADGGQMAGIANLSNLNTLISATYSSGLLETYSEVDIYTLALANKVSPSVARNYIMDCYSISQIKRNSVGGGSYFVNTATKSVAGEGDSVPIVYLNQPLNGSAGGTAGSTPTDLRPVDIGLISIPYGGDISDGKDISVTWNSMYAPTSSTPGEPAPAKKSLSNWRFSRYLNYGYASHNFGYLTNITTYTQTEKWVDAAGEVTEVESDAVKYPDDSTKRTVLKYTKVDYSNIVMAGREGDSNWYLGVPNTYKFEQMIDTVDEGGDFEACYNAVPHKYMLRYDFEVSTAKLGVDVGKIGAEFALDGNNKTIRANEMVNVLTNEWTSPLFGYVVGSITNLNLHNVKIKNASGTLATLLQGSMQNVSVTGEITSNTENVGGVVGELYSSDSVSIDVDSLVNINSSNDNAKVGGIAGEFSGSMMLATNAGQLIASGKNAVVGGIVGHIFESIVPKTRLLYSYNTNAVLSGYTRSDSATESYAGGIFGRATLVHPESGSLIEKVELIKCYNTGFVGAGNYASSGESYAGGLFGRSQGLIKIQECINEGAVESLSKMPTPEVVKDNVYTTGGSDGSSWTNNPGELRIMMTLDYDKDTDKDLVNAYGFGYVDDGLTNVSSTSTIDNIKNDGIVKDKDKKAIVFDRASVLNTVNVDGALSSITNDFYGIFGLHDSGAVYCNGYDSYGMPVRVYAVDTIQRSFGNPDNKSTNPIASLNSEFSSGSERAVYQGVFEGTSPRQLSTSTFYHENWMGIVPYPKGKTYTRKVNAVEVRNYSEDAHVNYVHDPSFLTDQSDKGEQYNEGSSFGDLYHASGTTVYNGYSFSGNKMEYSFKSGKDEHWWKYNFIGSKYNYYSSTTFKSYENVLSERNGLLYNGASKEDWTKVSVDECINELNSYKASYEKMEVMTINGQKMAVVYSEANLKGAYSEYTYQVAATFEGVENVESLTVSDFGIVSKYSSEAGNIQSSTLVVKERNAVGKSIKVSGTVYCSAETSGFNIVLKRTIQETIVLLKNNVKRNASTIEFTLKENSSDKNGTDKTTLSSAEISDVKNGNIIMKVSIGGVEFDVKDALSKGVTLAYSGGVAKLTLPSTNAGAEAIATGLYAVLSANLDNQILTYSLEGKTTAYEPAEITITPQISSASMTVENGASFDTSSSGKNYAHQVITLNDDLFVGYSRTETEVQINLDADYNTSIFDPIADDYVLGDGLSFGIYWQGGVPTLFDQDGSVVSSVSVDGVQISLSGSILTMTGATVDVVDDFFAKNLALYRIFSYVTPTAQTKTQTKTYTLSAVGAKVDVEYQTTQNISTTSLYGGVLFDYTITEIYSLTKATVSRTSTSLTDAIVSYTRFGGTVTHQNYNLASGAVEFPSVTIGDVIKVTKSATKYNPYQTTPTTNQYIPEGELVVDGCLKMDVMSGTTKVGTLEVSGDASKIETVFYKDVNQTIGGVESVCSIGYIYELYFLDGSSKITYFGNDLNGDYVEEESTMMSYTFVGGNIVDCNIIVKDFSVNGDNDPSNDTLIFLASPSGYTYKTQYNKTILVGDGNVEETNLSLYEKLEPDDGVFEYTVKSSIGGATVSSGNFEYLINGTKGTTKNPGNKISAENYGASDLVANYNISISKQASTTGGSSGTSGIEVVMLGDDIRLLSPLGANTKELRGNGYFVSFVSNKDGFIQSNEEIISNINVVGGLNLRGARRADKQEYSLFIDGLNSSDVKNVRLFGNIRNVNNVEDVSVQTIARASVSNPTYKFNNCASYICVNGLRASSSTSEVKAVLKDESKTGFTTDTNKNLLIAGDGVSGSNGEVITYEDAGSGYKKVKTRTNAGSVNGTVGKPGGTVIIEEASFGGYARDGAVGIGGYGADGSNGTLTYGYEGSNNGAYDASYTRVCKNLTSRNLGTVTNAGTVGKGNNGLSKFRTLPDSYAQQGGVGDNWAYYFGDAKNAGVVKQFRGHESDTGRDTYEGGYSKADVGTGIGRFVKVAIGEEHSRFAGNFENDMTFKGYLTTITYCRGGNDNIYMTNNAEWMSRIETLMKNSSAGKTYYVVIQVDYAGLNKLASRMVVWVDEPGLNDTTGGVDLGVTGGHAKV